MAICLNVCCIFHPINVLSLSWIIFCPPEHDISHHRYFEKLPMTRHLHCYANSSLLFMCKWILLSQPGVNVQLKASAMCSKVNQALALYTEGPVIFIMLNNTLSRELSSPHIPGQLLVSIIVYLSRGKINQNALGPPALNLQHWLICLNKGKCSLMTNSPITEDNAYMNSKADNASIKLWLQISRLSICFLFFVVYTLFFFLALVTELLSLC